MSYFKPLRNKGFGHVELVVAILFVVVFAGVGIRVLTASHAATAYLTQSGCQIRGRVWAPSNVSGATTNPCSNTCKAGTGTLVVAPAYNYCSLTETKASVISQATCASLGRVWLNDGCSRLYTQKTTAGPVAQCVSATATYTVLNPYDKCVVTTAATTKGNCTIISPASIAPGKTATIVARFTNTGTTTFGINWNYSAGMSSPSGGMGGGPGDPLFAGNLAPGAYKDITVASSTWGPTTPTGETYTVSVNVANASPSFTCTKSWQFVD